MASPEALREVHERRRTTPRAVPTRRIDWRAVAWIVAPAVLIGGLIALAFVSRHSQEFVYPQAEIVAGIAERGDRAEVDLSAGLAYRMQINSNGYIVPVSVVGEPQYFEGRVIVRNPVITVGEALPVNGTTGDAVASIAPDEWSWASKALRFVASPMDAWDAAQAENRARIEARAFPVLVVPGGAMAAINEGGVSAVSAGNGELRLEVTDYRMTFGAGILLVAAIGAGLLTLGLMVNRDFLSVGD